MFFTFVVLITGTSTNKTMKLPYYVIGSKNFARSFWKFFSEKEFVFFERMMPRVVNSRVKFRRLYGQLTNSYWELAA